MEFIKFKEANSDELLVSAKSPLRLGKEDAGLRFHKYEGAGNDFILIEDEVVTPSQIIEMSDRKKGIGADGLILLTSSEQAAIHMTFYNPDGKSVLLCGNGVRCCALHLMQNGLTPPFVIESESGLHAICLEEGDIGVQMPRPSKVEKWLIDGEEVLYTEVGVPHAYFLCDDVATFDLEKYGKHFVAHAAFANGCNINALQVEGNRLYLRTFERGVNGETLACGTGAVGAAHVCGLIQSEIMTASKSLLYLRDDILFGPASHTFSGRWK